jgi:adenylate cyclase
VQKLQRKLPFILFVIIYWVIVLMTATFMSLLAMRALLDEAHLEISEESHPMIYYMISWNQFAESLLFSIFLGILFFIVNEISEKLKWDRLNFGKALLLKTGLYLFGWALIIGIIYVILTGSGVVEAETYSSIRPGLNMTWLLLTIIFYIIMHIVLLNFIVQSVQKTGRQNLISFLTGKYHRPVVEDRVFMFLDLKSSTSLAERLGSIRYSMLIKDCFHDINDVAPYHDAQIYQYVGDEVVMTWEWKKHHHDFSFIDIYFAIQEAFRKRKEYYQEKYGIIPVFKAAIHGGRVTVAEIGDIKRDIAFHGDVLNTTSRLQDMCNELKENFLVTETLQKRINTKNTYTFKSMGDHILRGKTEKVGVFAISLS